MELVNILIMISSLSFLGYGVTYFTSSKMKDEFKRFNLEKVGTLTAVLELLGALGLIVGFWSPIILMISSGGLSLLMFLGVMTRIKVKDSLLVTIPALFYMFINAYIFYNTSNYFL
ncbi:MAG: DoxX family protein [bacterium]|jgi:uncharacterized membrane protein YphA (DoxX/SURF4 family)